jgi:hypothetical protein
MTKTKLLAGEEYKCAYCSSLLKTDGSMQMLVYILMPMFLSISFACFLLIFGFVIAVFASIITSILIYLLVSVVVPIETKNPKK